MKVTDLMIKITADAATFRAATQSATRASQQMAERISKNMRKVGAAMSAAVTLPLTMLAKSSLQAADIQAKAEAKVQQALVQTGNAAGFTLDQLKKLAAETQKKTLFGDEQILSDVTGKLLTFTNITGQNFQRLQGLVLDFSTQMKVDAASAAVTLGKALNNPIKATTQLTRVGITFTKEEEKQIKAMAEAGKVAQAQTIILDKLNATYGGQAEAAARTGAGAIKQMQMAWGDLKEVIGRTIMPAVTALANRLKALFERLQTLSPATQKAIVAFAAFAAGIGPVLLVLGSLSKILPAVKAGIVALTGALPALKAALAAVVSPLGLILSLLVGISVAYAGLAKKRNQWKSAFAEEVKGLSDEDLKKQKDSLLELIDAYQKEKEVRKQSSKNTAQAQRLAYASATGPGDYYGGAYAGGIADQVAEGQKVTTASGKTYSQADIDRAAEKLRILTEEENRRNEAKKEQVSITKEVNDAIDAELVKVKGLGNETEKIGGVLGDLKNQVAELEKKKLLPGTTVEEIARYNTEIKALQERIEQLSKATTADLTAMATSIEKVATNMTKAVAVAQNAGKAFQVQPREDKNNTARMNWALDMISSGVNPEDALTKIDEIITKYKAVFGDKIEELQNFMKERAQAMAQAVAEAVKSAMVSSFQGIGEAIVGGGAVFGNVLNKVINTIGQTLITLGTILIETSAWFQAFRQALAEMFANSAMGLVVGAAMIAAGGAMIAYAEKRAQKASSRVALANGGLAYGPTLALVGDNLNASSDPEVIAPLSKLKDYTGGGVQQIDLRVTGEFKTKGRDLVATIGKENYRYRTMGID